MEARLDLTMAELYRIFTAANERFHAGRLPRPAITIQSAGRQANTLGWCTAQEVWRDGRGTRAYEINLSAEWMHRLPLDVAETVLHEMAHLANLVDKIEDVSSNQYHNKRFKTAAERVGLVVEQMKGRGWARTSLRPETREWLVSLELNSASFGLTRTGRPRGAGGSGDGLTGKLKRWSCSCTNIRAAAEVVATCGKCGGRFVLGAKAGEGSESED